VKSRKPVKPETIMDNFFVRSWWVLALRGAAGILFALLTLAWPGLTLLSLIALFAAYALIGGAASVAGALRHRRSEDDWWLGMLLGLVSIGAGVVAVTRPALTALVLVMVMAANALVIGVLDIVAAIRLRRAIEGEWMLVLAGLASIAFGAIVFLYPFAGVLTLIWAVSLYAFVTGALLLMQAARVRSRARVGTHTQADTPSLMPSPAPVQDRRVLGDRRISPAR
jgi:uncharacterized membrane protein HdeD (DUF308 family)